MQDNNDLKIEKDGEKPHPESVKRVEDLKDRPPKSPFLSRRLINIGIEFSKGFKFINKYDLAATFFGSSRCSFEDDVYREARVLAEWLAKNDFTIITGGGPGVMEAANKGAKEAGGKSVGLGINLPEEQVINEYVEDSLTFDHFFTRKVMLSFASSIYVFYPGGFGTLDEFFEIITLLQTGKGHPTLVVLMGEDYWGPLLEWIEKTLYGHNNAIDKEDMDLYHLVDTVKEAKGLIRQKSEAFQS
ncbi:MAG: TIGR00730 family Rossman fold protein [Candidatus Magasanikbacteria bacterium]